MQSFSIKFEVLSCFMLKENKQVLKIFECLKMSDSDIEINHGPIKDLEKII